MNKFIILLSIISLNSCSFVLFNKDLNIKGDWYYFSGLDSIYTEIYFNDTLAQWNSRDYEVPPLNYQIEGDSLVLDLYNFGTVKRGLVAKIKFYNKDDFSITNKKINYDFVRIDSSEYTYSKYQTELSELRKLTLEKQHRDSIYKNIYFEYFCAHMTRRTLAEINVGKTTKAEVLNFLNEYLQSGKIDSTYIDFYKDVKIKLNY